MNTYIEHCLIVWRKENNVENRSTIEKKIINIIKSVDTKTCDHYQVLILAISFEFKPAIVHIFEYNKQLSEHYGLILCNIISFYIVYFISGIPNLYIIIYL